jgi:4-amino-4-deoxy-L-arabinose transferase-like glycosyltransferase
VYNCSNLLLLDELRDAWRSETRDHRIALIVIAVIGVDLRLLYIAQAMRYDEAVTYMYFVRHPWADALSLYTYPNNHLFHTLLAKAAITVFGNQPWALRLPAFIAGTLVIPATYAVGRALYGGRAALVAMALVASSGVLTLYSTNARGYSIVVLAFLLLLLAALRLHRGAPPTEWFTFAIIAALGLWTVPTMLYPLGAVALWFALSTLVEGKRSELRRLAIALGIALALTAVAYSPVISREGLAAVTRNKFVASSPWLQFFEQLPDTLGEALSSWGLGLPAAASIALLVCALVALRYHRRLSRVSVGIPLAAFAWCAWLLVVNHRAPYARVWLWFVPIAASLAGAGLVLLLERWARTRQFVETRAPFLSGAIALAAAAAVIMSYDVLLSRDTGTYLDAPQAAAALRGVIRPGDRVLAAIPTNGPLSYYFDREGIPSEALTLDQAKATRIIAIVDQAEGQQLRSVLGASPAVDTTQFSPPTVVAKFLASSIHLYERKHAPPP